MYILIADCSQQTNEWKGSFLLHLWGFADEVHALHQGADSHLEEVAFAVVLCDAAEGMHHQQLLRVFFF